MLGIIIIIFIIFGGGLALAAYATNPFNALTIIRQPYIVTDLKNAKVTNNNRRLKVHSGVLWHWFAIIKCGLHILHTRYIGSPRSPATTVDGIIADIHELRFRPDKLLLISGDHFNGLFVRNLGVFYYPMLDTRISSSDQNWHNRQVVYLQTVAYALGVFKKSPIPTTTIVETGPYSATCVNFYAYPSDTVYGIFYALTALHGKERASPADYSKPILKLHTQKLASQLTHDYLTTLKALYADYKNTAYDTQTGLISIQVHMSGAKDITRRQSAFYDNVIFWKTTALAMQLGVIPDDKTFLADLKIRILDTFWLSDAGYFLEDLSAEGVAGRYYSSDWLIVLTTNFLDPALKTERHYFERSINYIQTHKIDVPFPIKYQAETRAHRQFFAVRLAVASYGGDAIWSFWGMEYIKTLLLLHKATSDKKYLKTADLHIASYRQAILKNGGFPEVYDPHGKLLQTPFYRSIRQTGWVIGFEQVLAMRAAQN